MNKSEHSIKIPSNIRFDKRISSMEVIIYGELLFMINNKGFSNVSNSYIAELYDVSKVTVSRWISNLKKRGYITVEIITNDNKEVVERKIYIKNDLKKENI